MLIDVVESAYRTRNHYLVVSLISALRAHCEVTEVRLLELGDALVQTRLKTPDILVIFGGEQCDNFVIRRLCEMARVSVVWFTEDPFELTNNLGNFDPFDLVFTNDRISAARYGEKGHHLCLAANAEHAAGAPPFADRRYDVSFVGTLWPNRARFFAETCRVFDGLKTKFELTDNEYLRPALGGIKLPWQIGSGVDYLDFMRINRNSRISLMIDREFSASEQSPVSDTPGPRFFEAASVGACLFVDARVAGDIEALGFAPNRDYFCFSDVPEFERLLAAFRKSTAPFEAAALALREKVLKAHTYEHRVRMIVDLAKARLSTRPPVVATAPIGKRRILALAHNLRDFGGFGGAELYLQKLVERMPQHDVFILAHDGRQGFGARYVVIGPQGEHLKEFIPKNPFSELQLRHEEIERFFLRVVEDFGPDLLLINHLVGFPPSLAILAKYCGLSSVAVLHDYFFVCDEFNLLMFDHTYCGGPSYPAHRCDLCAYKRRGLPPGSALRRRNFFRYELEAVDVVVSNTRAVAKLVGKMSDVDLSGCEIIEPPLLLDASPQVPNIVGLSKIALIGNLRPHKGSDDLFEIACSLRDLSIEFHVFGNCDKRLMARAKTADLSNIKFHGEHAPGLLDEAILACDAALFLSRWPETFCMSLDEALAFKLVPIAYRIGAFAERITDEIGFLIDCHAQDVAGLLRSLHQEPAPILARARKLRDTAPRPDVFAPKYNALFARLVKPRWQKPVQGLSKSSLEPLAIFWAPSQWDAPHPHLSPVRRKKPKRGLRKVASRVWKNLRFWRRS